MHLKHIPAIAFIVALASCTSMRPLVFTNNRQAPAEANKKEVKFLDISSDDDASKVTKKEIRGSGAQSVKTTENNSYSSKPSEIESASSLQFKYAQLLNTDVEQVKNIPLYQNIDDWYGVPYKLGGTTKQGIDCSAFVQTIFISAFGFTLPRTARDQYNSTRRISQTQLQEGDLLFFNTHGGVSHVGIYLQNNKFVHASVSGVMISDMFDPYYVKHLVAAGRISRLNNSSASARP
jgi:cell wall-associated NlpC family hydrolase